MDPRRPRWPHPVWLALFVLAAAAAALSAGREPLDRALVGLVRPADFARDFVAAEDWIAGNPVYGEWPGRLERHAALLGIDSRIRGPFFAHPPTALLLVAPLVPLGFRAAALVWAGLSISLLAILVGVLADALPIRRPTLAAGLLLVALVSWPPVLYNLEKGQWSIALATLIALTWRDLGHGRERRAGVCLGIASLVKLTPLLFLLDLGVVRRRRTARGLPGDRGLRCDDPDRAARPRDLDGLCRASPLGRHILGRLG